MASYLQIYLVVVSFLSIFNTVQCFFSTTLNKRMYNKQAGTAEVNGLQSRTFAIWTLLSTVIRFMTSYQLHDRGLYHLTMITFLVAFLHFSTEIVLFRTAKLAGPAVSPVIVSVVGLAWMTSQRQAWLG